MSLRPILRPVLSDPIAPQMVFAPTDLRGLKVWAQFGRGITETGSGVSKWADNSGNGNDLLQAVDANRPALQSDGSILFDGIAHYLLTGAFTLAQPTTVYVLARHVTWTLNDQFYDGRTSFGGTLRQAGVTPNIQLAGTAVVDNAGLALNTYAAIAAVFNSTSSVLQINNTAPATGDVGTVGMGGFVLGARGALDRFGNIQVKECLVYNTAHDAATRQKVISHLASVGNLTI